MGNKFKEAFEYKIIYVFTIDDNVHKGLLKIGDATLHTKTQIDMLSPNSKELNQAALTRIKSYTNTAGVTPHLLHTELAIKTVTDDKGEIKLKAFRDYDVHEVLKNSNIENISLGETTGREWFKIDFDTALKAIDAVKKNIYNLGNCDKRKYTPFIFRPEQVEAITKTIRRFKKSDRMLWNAKMRFGKTVCALQVVKQMNFSKTIIITHRPVVNDGWYDDFSKIFHDRNNYIYGSKVNGYTVDKLINSGKKFVYFASMQDLRGSKEVGGKYEKNNIVFDTIWDCVIVDEAHEGTTTTIGDETIKSVVKENKGTKFLALSGTPFNILTDFDENSIYTWDYIMEQESKSEWDKLHFGDSNPYEELPELKIYTYDLGDIIANKNYMTFEDKAFNFHEFFRTWTGDFEVDYADMPIGAKVGDFVHESDVLSFLNLMTKEDDNSNYPFASNEYRNLFKHSLWILPGVKEAKALKKLMLKHPVFGNGMFDIVNVSGAGDEEQKSDEALTKVRKAIKEAGEYNYTITLSCGRLTTGVTVKEWIAVFMLSGSYSTSASNYLQTIFRVQSPCNKSGKIKETAYVFDFAPDRTLKMVTSAVSISSKAGKTTNSDKQTMGKFLNYCPVISVSGSEMKEYNANKLLQQLKRAYADKAVRNGFDDNNIYNDELFKLNELDIKKFNELKGIIGKSKAANKTNEIPVNEQGFTKEEYEEAEELNKKRRRKKELTQQERERLEELNKLRKLRNDAISILRGISIRMPLLIYGADIPYDEDINLDQFVDIIDDSSWNEFMPDGVTKQKFNEFKKYYDEEVFIAAGRKIRNIAKDADQLEPTERIKKIVSLFSYFKNPDKETVLTPWRVVNMHMSNCIGGWDFWDEKYEYELDEPRYVDNDNITKDIFNKKDSKVLEINSKTGLYPLYIAYSLYRNKCSRYHVNELTISLRQQIWLECIKENIFVICKTPMAKSITKRTLTGFTDNKINAHYFDDLVNTMKNKPKAFFMRVLKTSYWNVKGVDEMKFDAVVGNPPYMEMDGGAQASAKPIYQHFVLNSIKLNPRFISFIIPTRWYAGGKGLDSFRDYMLNDTHIRMLHDCLNPEQIFPNTNIRGGVCYFLWDKQYDNIKNSVRVITHEGSKVTNDILRPLKVTGSNIFIRDTQAITIISKIFMSENNQTNLISNYISSRRPFGLEGYIVNSNKFHDNNLNMHDAVLCYGKGKRIGYVEKTDIHVKTEWINRWKVFISRADNIGTELNDDNLNAFIGKPRSICTESYLVVGAEMNLDFDSSNNLCKYFRTKFARYLHSIAKISQDATAKTFRYVPVQNFSNNSDINWNNSISDIDKQLYSKYNLNNNEIDYIEGRIKSMEIITESIVENIEEEKVMIGR